MKFNERLLDLRKKKGWSQEELGYKLDVSRQTISKWEAGQTTPELEKLRNLAKIFEISVDELIKEESTNQGQNIKEEIKEEKIVKKSRKLIKWIISLIVLSIMILCALIVIKRVIIIRKIEKELLETSHDFKYMIVQKYEYLDHDEVFPSKELYMIYQEYNKDNERISETKVTDNLTKDYGESIKYYEVYNKKTNEWNGFKVDTSNKTYYKNVYDYPFEHNPGAYSHKILEGYMKNYNINIDRLDINDFAIALDFRIKIIEVDNGGMRGYYLSNSDKPYESYCDIKIDTLSETLWFEKVIYNEQTKDMETIERFSFKYDDDYVLLEEIQMPDLTEYTLLEYVEE